MSANLITDQWTAGAGIYGKFKARFACLSVRLLVNLGLTAPSLFFFSLWHVLNLHWGGYGLDIIIGMG